MKKIFFILCFIVQILVIAGCRNTPENLKDGIHDQMNYLEYDSISSRSNSCIIKKIDKINHDLSNTIDTVKSTHYNNLSLEETNITLPAFNQVSTLTLVLPDIKPIENIYSFFDDRFEYFFPKMYSSNEKKHEYRILTYDIPQSNEKYPYCFPTYSEYLKEFDNNSVSYNMIISDSKDHYLAVMNNGTIHSCNRGNANTREGLNSSAGIYFLSDGHKIIKYYTNCNSDDTYNLLDGNISIKEAVEFVEKFFLTEKISSHNLELSPYVSAVKVVDIGEGHYGYSFAITAAYKSIPFDSYDMYNSDCAAAASTCSDGREYCSMPGNAYMIEKNIIDGFTAIPIFYEIENENNYDSIIDLESAVKIVSDLLTENIIFKVSDISIVYRIYKAEQDKYIAFPCWKFKTYNSQNDRFYYIFVDAITGESHSYSSNGN